MINSWFSALESCLPTGRQHLKKCPPSSASGCAFRGTTGKLSRLAPSQELLIWFVDISAGLDLFFGLAEIASPPSALGNRLAVSHFFSSSHDGTLPSWDFT